MKQLGILLLCFPIVISCKTETKQTENAQKNENLTLLKGQFVYFDGAAVLQTDNEIYGVFVTDKLEELNKQAEALKTNKTDMVNVEIQGRVSQKKDAKILWENKVEILEILSVKPVNKANENLIKLSS